MARTGASGSLGADDRREHVFLPERAHHGRDVDRGSAGHPGLEYALPVAHAGGRRHLRGGGGCDSRLSGGPLPERCPRGLVPDRAVGFGGGDGRAVSGTHIIENKN